jgi:hypothetical protein
MEAAGLRPHPRRVIMKITPTGHPASCLSSCLRLMLIRADHTAVGAINRPLRLVHGHAVEMVEWQIAMKRDEVEKK